MRFIHGVVVTVVIEIAVCNELEKSFKVLKRPPVAERRRVIRLQPK